MFENASQHNEQRHEKMAQEGRRKTISDDLDEIHQVFENMRQHNELQQDQGGNLIWHACDEHVMRRHKEDDVPILLG